MDKSFGTKLRDHRKKQGMTVQALADTCGISHTYISLIENDKRLPGKKNLPKLAAALNLKTVVILNWYLEDISYKLQKSFENS